MQERPLNVHGDRVLLEQAEPQPRPECIFERTHHKHVYRCRNRGCRVSVWEDIHPPERVHRHCSGIASWGLGDLLAWLLRRLGFRRTRSCKCPQRQAALNRTWWNLLARVGQARVKTKRCLTG